MSGGGTFRARLGAGLVRVGGGGTAHTYADTKLRPHRGALLLGCQIKTAVPEALTMSMPLSVPRTS